MADSDDNIPADSTTSAAKSGPWTLIAVVVLVTVIAILLVPGEEEAPPHEELPPVTTQQQSLLEDATEQAEAAVDSENASDAGTAVEAPAGPLPPGVAARQLIAQLRSQSPLDLDKAFAAAQEHQAEGRLDDAYLLYFFAAREGHGEAAMTLAQQADPALFSDGGLLEHADEVQAHKWYTRAKQAGVEQADASLTALYQRVEDAAHGGDDRARNILLQWK